MASFQREKEKGPLCRGKEMLSTLVSANVGWAGGCTSVEMEREVWGHLLEMLHSAPAVDHTETAFQMVTIIGMLCLSFISHFTPSKRD